MDARAHLLRRRCFLLLPLLALAAGCAKNEPDRPAVDSVSPSKGASVMQLVSSAFGQNGEIPSKHTCEGKDVSPPLSFSGAPPGTKSYALIVDDPDAPDPKAPKRVWVHWVVYDIPAGSSALAEGANRAPEGARDGKNDWGRTGYGGPCPPIGRHRYFHKIYALDVLLGDRGPLDKAGLTAAMQGHVLASGELIGTYEKRRE
jgi:Raf kinase inhibitor-like YbhB/YbcL family protein